MSEHIDVYIIMREFMCITRKIKSIVVKIISTIVY